MHVVVVSTGSNREAVVSAMGRWSIEPLCCSGIQQARQLLPRGGRSLVFCEEQLPDGTYRELLRELSRERHTQLVVISSANDLEQIHREASALGAFETIASPCAPADVQWVAIRALQNAERHVRNNRRQEFELSESSGPAAHGG